MTVHEEGKNTTKIPIYNVFFEALTFLKVFS